MVRPGDSMVAALLVPSWSLHVVSCPCAPSHHPLGCPGKGLWCLDVPPRPPPPCRSWSWGQSVKVTLLGVTRHQPHTSSPTRHGDDNDTAPAGGSVLEGAGIACWVPTQNEATRPQSDFPETGRGGPGAFCPTPPDPRPAGQAGCTGGAPDVGGAVGAAQETQSRVAGCCKTAFLGGFPAERQNQGGVSPQGW